MNSPKDFALQDNTEKRKEMTHLGDPDEGGEALLGTAASHTWFARKVKRERKWEWEEKCISKGKEERQEGDVFYI